MILNLFSTTHCHLCEQAEDIVRNLPQQDCLQLNIIEIADDNLMMGRYGNKIPVLQRDDTKVEINWPFSLEQVQRLIM
jgi:hypothetical protein